MQEHVRSMMWLTDKAHGVLMIVEVIETSKTNAG